MVKIVVKPKDEITAIVGQVISAEDADITIEIPSVSVFGRSILNFQLLAREGKSANKRITIVSDSEEILKMASNVGHSVSLMKKREAEKRGGEKKIRSRSKNISDVIPSSTHTLNLARSGETSPETSKEEKRVPKKSVRDLGVAASQESVRAHYAESQGEKSREGFAMQKEEIPVAIVREEGYPEDDGPKSAFHTIPGILKRGLMILVVTALFLGILYGSIIWLPKAEVRVVMKKYTWEFSDAITARTNLAGALIDPPTVPLEIAVLTKSIEIDVPTTGRKDVSQKARGVIEIFNAYSSEPQTLVATTRFMSPDKKIFRLDKAVTVPGAKIVDGKIAPSSIRAAVSADTPGEVYNIGPVEKFIIPGFEGSPKYQGFYGVADAPMTGGFIGEANVVTQADMDKARGQARETLEAALRQELTLKMPEGFRGVEGFEEVAFEDITFSHSAGEASDVLKAHADVRLRSAFFKEEHMKDLFKTLAKNALGFDVVPRAESLQYGVGRIDFSDGQGSFPVQYQSTLARGVDVAVVEQSLLGKNKTETKSLIFALPGLESATVSLWPFWVRSVPKNVQRVEIIVE